MDTAYPGEPCAGEPLAAPWDRPFNERGAVGQRFRDCVFDNGMTQRPIVLVHFVIALLLILGGESVFEPSKRNLSTDFFALSSRISRQYSITSFIAL